MPNMWLMQGTFDVRLRESSTVEGGERKGLWNLTRGKAYNGDVKLENIMFGIHV